MYKLPTNNAKYRGCGEIHIVKSKHRSTLRQFISAGIADRSFLLINIRDQTSNTWVRNIKSKSRSYYKHNLLRQSRCSKSSRNGENDECSLQAEQVFPHSVQHVVVTRCILRVVSKALTKSPPFYFPSRVRAFPSLRG
jgi:hypothetical protein